MTATIPAVILIVILFLFIFDIDFLRRKVGYKIYHQSSNNHTPITASICALNTFTLTLQNNPRQIQDSSKQTIQSLMESIIQIIFTIINNGPLHKFGQFKINICY
jgi:hypothetical protein